MDMLYLALLVVLSGVSILLVVGCERLRKPS